MAADSKNDVKESTTSTDAELKKAKKKKGLLSRVWGAIFRLHGDDFEKRLQYISKEEAAILSRITRRSNSWRRMTRHLILFSVLLEVKCFSFYYFLDMVIELNLTINILVPVPLWGLLVPISFFVGGGRLISEIACPQWLVGTRYGSVMVFRKLFPLIMFVCLSVVALELRFFIISQAIAIGYAIMITRSLDLNWKMRALRLLPMFLLPLLSSITYFTLRGFTRMFDQKDQKTLEKLRAERQAKIDELKERTNYYTTQQLIQKYDPDPAAKAAAATVLASKLGADSGLKVFVGDDSQQNVSLGKSNDLEVARTSGLRNRKPSPSNNSMQNASTHHIEEHTPNQGGFEGTTMSQQHQMVVEHHPQTGSSMHDGGWIARLAALLVGEDPTQSYALICGNCHMHNGLARKEEFPYVSYYCPHCHALNQAKQSERVSGSNSPSRAPSVVEDADVVPSAGGSIGDRISESNSPVAAVDAISGS